MLNTALICLALTVYYEAKSEPVSGQEAVAVVTLNRAKLSHKPVCNVVFAPRQYSWTKGHKKVVPGHIPTKQVNQRQWETAQRISREALAGQLPEYGEIISFHSVRVKPAWNLPYAYTIGGHKFYTPTPAMKLALANTH